MPHFPGAWVFTQKGGKLERVKSHREIALEMADAQLWHSELKLTEENAVIVGKAVMELAKVYLEFLDTEKPELTVQ